MEEQRAGGTIEEIRDFFAPEPLHPALQPYVYATGHGYDMLNHPLVQQIFYTPAINKHANQMYAYKMKAVARAIKEHDWHSYVFLHERPYRARALAGVMHKIPAIDYWPLLREVWLDTENLWQWGTLKRKLLSFKLPHRELLMNEAEHNILKGFDEVVPPIYRGYTPPGKATGWSWTLDRRKAEWFARRFQFNRVPHVVEGEAHTKDIIAYFEGRNEWEIVIDPRKIVIVENVALGRKSKES